MRARFLLVGLAVVTAAVACDGGESSGPPAGSATGPALPAAAVELPAGAVPSVLSRLGDDLLVGVRQDGHPGLVRRTTDGSTSEVPVNGVSPYGKEATWQSIASDGTRLLAIGGERGGAHGNVRWSVWTGSAAGVTELPQGFSTFGGYGAGDLLDAVRTPAGDALVGTWESAQVGFDVAVWTPDGDTWVRQSSAGTALETRRGALGFPMSAAGYQRGIVAAGWRLADGRQQPAVWRSESGNTGWTAAALPLGDGKAGAAIAVRCGDTACGATGWVDGKLAVWRLADGAWTRLAGAPAITVGDRDPMVAPVDLGGRTTVVVQDGATIKLAQADGASWTVRDLTGPTGTVTALTVLGDALYLVAGPDETTQALWRIDTAAIR